jgi:DNA-binding transcriptional ArsR family regulator
VCDIAEHVGISESAVSHQLRLMRGLRIVRGRREGRCVYYTLDDHHILDLFQQGLRHVSEERR